MKTNYPITWFDSIDSTNAEARRELPELNKMSVIAARFQSAGRGQRGNTWQSASGENLTFTIVLKYTDSLRVSSQEQFVVSEVSALSVRKYIKDAHGIDSKIKWPNDIYVGDRKICGMLIENASTGTYLSSSIIGIGINLNQTDFPAGLLNPTSVALVRGGSYSIERELERFIETFTSTLRELEAGNRDHLRHDYLEGLYRKDSPCQYKDYLSDTEFTGTIKGISDTGLLLVEMPDGKVKSFSFKEIGYIL